MANIWILAQAETQETSKVVTSEPVSEQETTAIVSVDPNNGAVAAKKPQGMGQFNLILLAVMVFVMFMVMFRGPRKKQQEHQKMVQSLQKNDRVRTIGGIYGTVVDVKDNEIVLKIDESNNTKIRVSPSAIGSKIADEK